MAVEQAVHLVFVVVVAAVAVVVVVTIVVVVVVVLGENREQKGICVDVVLLSSRYPLPPPLSSHCTPDESDDPIPPPFCVSLSSLLPAPSSSVPVQRFSPVRFAHASVTPGEREKK